MATITLNQIIKQIELLATAHKQIKTVNNGPFDLFLENADNVYPACHFDVSSVSLSGKNLSVGVSFFFMDRVLHEKTNELDVFSDQLSIAQDIISQLQYDDFPFQIGTNVPMEMFTDSTPDLLGGVKVDVTFDIPYLSDRCAVPSTYFFPITDSSINYPNYPDYISSKQYVDNHDIVAIEVTGTTTQTITLTKGDGTTLSDTFTGGGASSISTLLDVNVSSIANNDLFVYDLASTKWVNKSFSNYLGGTVSDYVRGDGTIAVFPTLLSSDNLIKEVRNNSGATITKGTVVYINGALGNKATIGKALATSDSTSAQTYGVVQNDIPNNTNGFIVVIGDVSGLDTSAYTDGTQLYLSPSVAGGYTSVKQLAPNHLVYVGIVLRSHPTLGVIGVKIQNGYELDEIHDCQIVSPTNGQVLQYDSSVSLWKNATISTTNIYTANGTLTGNRVVTLSTFSLEFTGSKFTSTDVFFNMTSGSTNIGYSTAPTGSYKFAVNGTSLHNDDLLVYKNASNFIGLYPQANGTPPYLRLFYSGALDARLYVLNAAVNIGARAVSNGFGIFQAGNSTYSGLAVSTLGATGGFVAVTNTSADASFHASAPLGFSCFISFREQGISEKGLIGYANGSNDMQIRVNGATTMITGTNAATFYSTGSVGIGTTATPSYKFEVNGTARFNNSVVAQTVSSVNVLDIGSIRLGDDGNGRYLEGYNGMIVRNSNVTYPNNYLQIGNDVVLLRSNGLLNLAANGGTLGFQFSLVNSPSTTMLKFMKQRNDGVKSAIICSEDFTVATATPVHLYIYGGKETTASNLGHLILQHDGTNDRGIVAIGTNSPNASAKLQIDSTTKGFLIPRMTTTDRNNISTPAVGLSIYNTTTNKIETWDGTVWNAHW